MNVKHPTANIERRIKPRSYGMIHRANLPIEIFRTERPVRRFLRKFFQPKPETYGN